MEKILKISTIILIMLLALFFMANTSYGIDLNLTDSLDDTSESSSNTSSNTNESSSNTTTNTSTNTNTSESSNNTSIEDDTLYSGETNDYVNTSTNSTSTEETASTTTVSQVQSSSGLTTSDIINIFIAVIGILLIILSIAILIKINKQ